MTVFLFVYFIFHTLIWLLAFLLYGWWVGRRGGNQRKSLAGIGAAYGFLLTEILPLTGWMSDHPVLPGRRLEDGPCLLFLGAVIGLGLAGWVRFSSCMRGQKALGACSTETDPLASPDTRRTFRHARETLAAIQRTFSERLGITVPLVLTESLAGPVLFGLNPHRICVPVHFTRGARDLEGLLEPMALWVNRRRYRTYMFLWWLAQFHLLLQPLLASIRRALETEMAQEAMEQPKLGARYRAAAEAFNLPIRASGSSMGMEPIRPKGNASLRHRWPGALIPVLVLTVLCVSGTWMTGGLRISDLADHLGRRKITGYSVHAYDAEVRFRNLPGRGGALVDGLHVDTTRDNGRHGCSTVRLPLGLLEAENLVPFGADALNIHLEWTVVARPAKSWDPPALKVACSEQTGRDKGGRQELFTFHGRTVLLPAGMRDQGSLDLPIRLHPFRRNFPGSTDVIYGPVLYVPPGWKIEFTNYLLTQISPESVPDAPTGEEEEFVAWYLRNGGKPAQVDLRWQSLPPRHS